MTGPRSHWALQAIKPAFDVANRKLSNASVQVHWACPWTRRNLCPDASASAGGDHAPPTHQPAVDKVNSGHHHSPPEGGWTKGGSCAAAQTGSQPVAQSAKHWEAGCHILPLTGTLHCKLSADVFCCWERYSAAACIIVCCHLLSSEQAALSCSCTSYGR